MSFSVGHTRLALWCVLSATLARCPALVQASPPDEDPQQVLTAWNQAYRAHDWGKAIELGLTLNELVPRNSSNQYNLACAYSLNGDVQNAVKWLGKAAKSGFYKVKLIETDSDLTNGTALW